MVGPNRYANFNKVGVPFVAGIFLLKRCSTIQVSSEEGLTSSCN